MTAVKNTTELSLGESVSSSYLFSSDFYQIKNWSFDFKREGNLKQGYNECFCLVFIKKGNLAIDLAPHSYNMHIGHVVLEKAHYEYTLRPTIGECSIFNFTSSFYEQLIQDYSLSKSFFFGNSNLLSVVLSASPEIDYLHHQIMKKVEEAGKLELDSLVMKLVDELLKSITDKTLDVELPASIRKNHISTIERAKLYLQDHFAENISLQDLAAHCHISPFHFGRLFKKFTNYSPHQYLLLVRLKHAEMLLRNTPCPILDICFSSGFNSMEHFATMFKQHYQVSPSQYRKE